VRPGHIKPELIIDQDTMEMERRVVISSEISDFFMNISANDDKSSVIGSSIAADLEATKLEAIKKQKWYIIKFQSFCETDVNPIDRRNYEKYFVLGEVTTLVFFFKYIVIF
jgi:hypothetical protein